MNKKRDFLHILDLRFVLYFLCTVYYSIRTVFVVFLVVLGVITLSKVSPSLIDYTAIFLLSVLTHLKVKKQK